MTVADDQRRARVRKRARRRPGQRAGLAVERVLAEARAIVETEGVEHLTMRTLAERLGVAPNALYSYVPDKIALLDAVLDELLGDVRGPDPDEVDWEEGLKELMRSSRRFLLEHPDLIPHYLARRTSGPQAIRLGEETLRFLAEAGLSGDDAVDALQILLVFTFGAAAQEAPRLAEPEPELRRRRNEAAFKAARGRPRVREVATVLARSPGDETFERGLRWIIDGIRATRP